MRLGGVHMAPLAPLRTKRHYPSRLEKLADGWIHGIGLAVFSVAAIVLLSLSIWPGGFGGWRLCGLRQLSGEDDRVLLRLQHDRAQSAASVLRSCRHFPVDRWLIANDAFDRARLPLLASS